MSSEEDKRNKTANTLSTAEVKNIFIKINNQIQSLHECSNSDFFALNNSFKKNFDVSIKISDYAKQLIHLLHENATFTLSNDFTNFQNNVIDYYSTIQKEIKQLLINTDELDSSSSSLMFPLNTINQNLLTFDFLISNYNVFHTNKNNNTNHIHKIIQKSKNQFDKIINLIDQLNNKTDLIKHKAEDLDDSINLVQDKLDMELKDSIEIIEIKKKEAENKLKEIDVKSGMSNNINDIITNLQYHDILRQKMEHIQKIHNDVIEKLQNFEKKEQNLKSPTKLADCLLFINEIAELQSSQLIHVNKRYQVAIRIISENIHKIGENVSEINNISQEALGYKSINNTNFLFKITQNIDNIYKKFLENFYSFIELTSNLKEFKNLQEEFSHSLNQAVSYLNDFLDVTQKFINTLKNKNKYDIKEQFVSLFNDINNSKTEIDNQLKDTIRILGHVQNDNSSIQLIENAQNNFFVFADVFIQKLKIHSREANQKLLDNKNLCRSITSDIHHSLKQVTYYEYFEKIIEKIISDLNTLNKTISSVVIKKFTNKEKKLSTLKNHYTTGSEHNIHDIFIDKGKEETDYFDDTQDEEDNIELF